MPARRPDRPAPPLPHATGRLARPPGPDAGEDRVLARVLAVVAELVGELRGAGGGALDTDVGPGDALERDLGISSLERVELLLRLEQAFGVRLGDAAMVAADTPADLAAAIVEAAAAGPPPDRTPPPGRVAAPDRAPAPGRAGAATAAAGARTLVDALAWHVERTPDRTHIHLREDDGAETPLSYRWLWDEARAVAGGLAARGLHRGDPVAIMLRTERRFFPTFIGTLMAGGVPAPLYPPFRADRIEEYVRRQAAILRNAGARLLVTFTEVARVAGLIGRHAPALEAVVTAEQVAAAGAPGPDRALAAAAAAAAAGDAPALIQYTSGSTGQPKGVLLSHANLLANIRAIGRRLAIDAGDVGVSWLPLYHDMGLIGAWLGPLYFGAPLALMSPLAFLSRPARWLQALHAHRGTISPAPNFAYDLCAARITDAELDGLDLSSVRILLNGAEAVSPDTLRRFAERFAPCGLRPGAVYPVYGLAECALGLATPALGAPPRIDRVRRAPFQADGRAAPAAPGDAAALQFVSCGRALPDHALQVVDADDAPAAERQQGRVRFRGPSATRGYYRNPEATRALIGADGWLETGDLGYLADGDLFLTGRAKDLIIKAGRNLVPHEAEAAAGAVPGIRTGCVAAFGAPDPASGTERFVLVAETRVTDPAAQAALRQTVIRQVADALGVPPDRVTLAAPGAVLKTSSGKIRRGATRDAWLRGRLGRGRAGLAGQWIRLAAGAAGATLADWSGRAGRVLFTAWVGAVVAVTGAIGWGLLHATPAGPAINRLVGRWVRLVLALAGCRLEVAGRAPAPADGPVVFAANHASYLDAPLLLAVLPPTIRFAAKARLTGYPILGAALRKGGHLPIAKRDQAERVADAAALGAPLAAGAPLAVFPEGTFLAAPRLLPFRLGAFRAAADAGCPVVPVALRGTRRLLPAGARLLRPGRIVVTFGAPIRPAGSAWPEIVRLRDETRAFIAAQTGEG